jgi:hypothetical protein
LEITVREYSKRPLKTFYYRSRSLGWDTRGSASEPAKAIRAAIYRMLTQKFNLVEIYMHDELICVMQKTPSGISVRVHTGVIR